MDGYAKNEEFRTILETIDQWLPYYPFCDPNKNTATLPLPKISDLLQNLAGFKYATVIDLSMGYCHIPLVDEHSQKCHYKRPPIGIVNSTDIFQAIIMAVVSDLDFARAYMDDILIISNGTFEDYLTKLDRVLYRLKKAGFLKDSSKGFYC
jgi:hypothetical protein